ncbi:hypothetical protein APHAL10511_007076 [Amanita phalloides]|nr:hypothetical protein APHAL10511_007076 [Amanita phalloides]
MDHRINGRIPLIVAQQTAYVWDVDDIATLRSEHRICGILTGTLPHLSQQNVFLGVPLVLMPEEVVHLVEKGVAILVNDFAAYSIPALGGLQHWALQQETLNNQYLLSQSKGITASARASSEEAQKKRREREQRRAKVDIDTDPTGLVTNVASSVSVPQNRSSHNLIIPASSTNFSWYQQTNEHHLHASVESAMAAGIWKFPSDSFERARCAVFSDLHEKGYFIGGGIKFGGHYLVYPGDPLRYHSHFAATVHETSLPTLRPMEIVAHGRLGTGTKKTHLLCGWDDAKREISYLSIEWAGFG